jgi:hypothetical protein
MNFEEVVSPVWGASFFRDLMQCIIRAQSGVEESPKRHDSIQKIAPGLKLVKIDVQRFRDLRAFRADVGCEDLV